MSKAIQPWNSGLLTLNEIRHIENSAKKQTPQNRIHHKEPNLVVNKKDDKGEILIYDDIGPDWWGMIGVATIANALKELGEVKELTVRINSGGGSVFEGVGIYNQLKTHAAKVIIQIDALAASIASIIAMAGDEIVMAENALMMIHNPMGFTFGDRDEHMKTVELLDSITETLVGTYTKRTGQTAEDVTGWMNDETWMTAAQAKERGFADSIGENKGVEAKLTQGVYNYRRVPDQLKGDGPDDDPPAAPVKNGGDDGPPQTPLRNLAARKLDLMKLAG